MHSIPENKLTFDDDLVVCFKSYSQESVMVKCNDWIGRGDQHIYSEIKLIVKVK